MDNSNDSEKNSFLWGIIYGKVISYKFFVRFWPQVLGVILLLLASIALKYKSQTQMEDILKLTKELNNAKTEMVRESAIYNSKIREPEMRQMLDTLHTGLTVPEQPPFHL